MKSIYLYLKVPHSAKAPGWYKREYDLALVELVGMLSAAHPFEEPQWFLKELDHHSSKQWSKNVRVGGWIIDKKPFINGRENERISFVLKDTRPPRDNPFPSRSKFRRLSSHTDTYLIIVHYDGVLKDKHEVRIEKIQCT